MTSIKHVHVMAALISGVFCASIGQAGVITEVSRLGSFGFPGFGGAYGFVNNVAVSGSAYRGNFGSYFGGPSQLSSLTLDQYDDAGRRRLNEVELRNEAGQTWTLNFTDTQDEQTIDLTALNGGNPIPATYVQLFVRSQHGGGDANLGIMSYSFDGTFLGPTESDNINAGLPPVATGLLNGGSYPVSRATDGNLVSLENGTSTFFVRDEVTDSITVNYATPQSIAAIGLGLTGGPGRVLPKFGTLSYDGGSQVITFDPDILQYNRYTLPSAIVNTDFLTLTFPDGTIDTDWYSGGDNNWGVTEFEAFALVVPEPSSMVLLVMGGLLLALRFRLFGMPA